MHRTTHKPTSPPQCAATYPLSPRFILSSIPVYLIFYFANSHKDGQTVYHHDNVSRFCHQDDTCIIQYQWHHINTMAPECMTLRPNPVSDFLTICNLPQTPSTITIQDTYGRTRMTLVHTRESATLNLSHLPPQIYFITISDFIHTLTKKIIKLEEQPQPGAIARAEAGKAGNDNTLSPPLCRCFSPIYPLLKKRNRNSFLTGTQIGQFSFRLGRAITACSYVASLSGRFLTDQTITALRLRFVRRYPYLSPKGGITESLLTHSDKRTFKHSSGKTFNCPAAFRMRALCPGSAGWHGPEQCRH